jgi:hypothetical protein
MKHAIYGFLCGFLALAVTTCAFTWYVDPFGYYGRAPFGLFDDGYSREFKPAVILRYPHDVTIMGTSKTIQIDPDRINECTVYNASFNGARIEEILYFVERYLPPDTFVLIGLDLFSFKDEPMRESKFGRKTPGRLAQFTLSIQAVRTAVKTLKQWGRNEIVGVKMNGARETDAMVAMDSQRENYSYSEYFKFISNSLYKDFRLSKDRFAVLERIREILEKRRQPYAAFINPIGNSGLRYFAENGLSPHFEEFRHRVKSILPDAYDFNDGRYGSDRLYYKTDPMHYLPETGRRFITEILSEQGCRPRPNLAAEGPRHQPEM